MPQVTNEEMPDNDTQPAVVIDRRVRSADPTQANPTLTAITQLLTFMSVVVAFCVLAASHTLSPDASSAIIGALAAHAGIIGYNGATKGGRQ